MKVQYFQLEVEWDESEEQVALSQDCGSDYPETVVISTHQIPELIRTLNAIDAQRRAKSGSEWIARIADSLGS